MIRGQRAKWIYQDELPSLDKYMKIFDDMTPEDKEILEKVADKYVELGCTSFILNKEELEQLLNGTNGETEEGIGDCR